MPRDNRLRLQRRNLLETRDPASAPIRLHGLAEVLVHLVVPDVARDDHVEGRHVQEAAVVGIRVAGVVGAERVAFQGDGVGGGEGGGYGAG